MLHSTKRRTCTVALCSCYTRQRMSIFWVASLVLEGFSFYDAHGISISILYEEPLVLWLIWNLQEGTRTYDYCLTHLFPLMVSLSSRHIVNYLLLGYLLLSLWDYVCAFYCFLIFLHFTGRQEYQGGRDLRERLGRMRSPLHNSPGRRDPKTRHSSHGKSHACCSHVLWPYYILVFTFCSYIICRR